MFFKNFPEEFSMSCNEKQIDASFFKAGPQTEFDACSDGNMSEFKAGEDFYAELAKAEQENRKEFADNELSVVMPANESKRVSDEGKWWNASSIQQTSKL